MAEPAQTSQTEVVKVLDKIKKEMMERKQLRAQNETNKQLARMNKNLEGMKDTGDKKEENTKDFELKFPTVNELVGGFARVSPIFTRDYATWMKDTIDVGVDGNQELERISSRIERLGQMSNSSSTDDTSVEYLDLISDQMKAANDDSLKRLDNQGDTLQFMSAQLVRIGDTLDDIERGVSGQEKRDRDQLTRLYGIEEKLGRVGGLIVGSLKRIYEGEEKWREKDELRRAEEGKEGKNNPRAGSVIPKDDDAKDPDSSGVGAAIAAMLGLNAVKGFLGGPFKAIGKVLGVFFGMFGKLGNGITKLLGPFGKVFKFLKVGPLALISAIWDFGKGFINAKDILGKATVTIVDRVRAGLSELVGGFGDLFDWVSKIFGFDTDMGKKLREFTLWITEAPAKWLQGIVDWVSNDLFAGITRNTSLTDIPGKLADNLQTELMKLVDWITGGISSFIDEGIGVASKVVEDIKKGFAENVKKPFYNMLNAITNAMFDIVDKFVSIIPDALGGEAARNKMAEARATMLIGTDETPSENTPSPTNQQTPPEPNVNPSSLQPMPSGVTSDAVNVTDRNAQLRDAYSGLSGMFGATPVQGRAASNVGQIQSAYAQPPASVVAPVIQSVDNSKKVNTTTNFNSTSLEPSNQTDKSRILWDW